MQVIEEHMSDTVTDIIIGPTRISLFRVYFLTDKKSSFYCSSIFTGNTLLNSTNIESAKAEAIEIHKKALKKIIKAISKYQTTTKKEGTQ